MATLPAADRLARAGILVQLLATIRCLGEYYRLRYLGGASFDPASAEPFIRGALVAACFCFVAVLLCFGRWWRSSVAVSVLCVAALIAVKLTLID
jgi:hypothetical protein